MKRKLATTLVLVAAVVMSTLASFSVAPEAKAVPPDDPDTPQTFWQINGYPPTINDNVILKWDEELLQAVRANPAATGPTVTARALGVLHTATYDAWAAYDPIAKVTRPDGPSQQPKAEITPDNKKKAISYAAYHVLMDLFPNSPADFPAQMKELTYPSDGSSDGSTASAVGIQAARAVLAFRHNDGSNQTLDTKGTDDPKDDTVIYPYPACTPTVTTNCYSPQNDWNNVTDPWRWQPLCVLTAQGIKDSSPPVRDSSADSCTDATDTTPSHYTLQRALTPQWGKIASFAPLSAIQYKVPGPAKNLDGTFSTADIERALADTSNLDDVRKAKAEYWADGPGTEFPPGHAAVFAQVLSRKRGHSLDTDVQLFFALGNAELDASIASWNEKYKWDFVRPVSAIREYYKDKDDPDGITTWLGPNKGYGKRPAEEWMPYQALTVVTPGFPEYVSGHSTFSAAGSIILRSYTTSDIFNAYVMIPANWSQIDPGVPASPVTLSWSTFTAAADQAGLSRRYGGIHFWSGDYHARMLGNLLGRGAYSKAQSYIQGKIGS
jgi:hypothetical protein